MTSISLSYCRKTFLLIASVLLACLCLVTKGFPAGSLIEEMDNCSKMRDPRVRLDCYDALQSKYGTPVFRGLWKLKTKIFPDQSRHTYLTLRADSPLEAGEQSYAPTLVLRCRDHEAAAYIITGAAPKVDHGTDGVTVLLWFDNEKRKQYVFSSKTAKFHSLFAQSPKTLIKKMLKHKLMKVQFTLLKDQDVETTFSLSGLDAVIDELDSSCPLE